MRRSLGADVSPGGQSFTGGYVSLVIRYIDRRSLSVTQPVWRMDNTPRAVLGYRPGGVTLIPLMGGQVLLDVDEPPYRASDHGDLQI